MLSGRTTLMNVFLWLVCLSQVLMPGRPRRPRACSRESVREVRELITQAKKMKWFECRLYTPTMEDYQQKCPNSILGCFAEEVEVLNAEWATVTALPSLARKLRDLRRLVIQPAAPECRQCEVHAERAAEDFLTRLSAVLQQMNSQNCDPGGRPRRAVQSDRRRGGTSPAKLL